MLIKSIEKTSAHLKWSIGDKNKNPMLEYAKVILPKVSFSRELFRKELSKCIAWVEPNQINDLRIWCYINFKRRYPNVLAEAFADIAA